MGALSGIITNTPTYELVLPSNGKTIKYRPFLVKEEKMLLIASESKNEKEIYRAMQDVVSSCTFGQMEIEKSPLVDIEYLFLKIRSKSVGETAKPVLKCSKCQTGNEVQIDLSAVEATRDPKHTTKIQLDRDIVLEMHHPRISDIELVQKYDNEGQRFFALMASCIDKIFTPNNTFVTKDLDISDVMEFIESMTQDHFKTLSNFFDTMPQLKKEVSYKCKKCESEETFTLRGAQDFF